MASLINLPYYYKDENCACLPCNIRVGYRREDQNETSLVREQNEIMKKMEELLASSLKTLSLQERTEAFDDVHCVGDELKETPQKMKQALEDFDAGVQKESHKHSVYETAVQQNRAFVEDDSFRLKFLRANFYNVDKSVHQMMRFLKLKETYFGIDKVAKEITLDDLNEEDMEVVLSGVWHVQEERDRSGRVILHAFSNLRWKTENLVRGAYIVFFNILASEEVVQTKGAVHIVHNVARTGQQTAMPQFDTLMTVNDALANIFPFRNSAMHFCLHHQAPSVEGEGSAFLKSLLLPVLKAIPLYETVRTRIHDGHGVELQYQLRTHGIPLDSFPVDMDGKVREYNFYNWFYLYQQAERDLLTRGGEIQNSTLSIPEPTPIDFFEPPAIPKGNHSSFIPLFLRTSVVPSENDILLGRGKFSQSWPGNVEFREFLEGEREDYDRLPRNKRKNKTVEITKALLATGIRFYDQDKFTGDWVEADFAQARLKVSTTFRTLRKGKSNVG